MFERLTGSGAHLGYRYEFRLVDKEEYCFLYYKIFAGEKCVANLRIPQKFPDRTETFMRKQICLWIQEHHHEWAEP